MARLLCRCGYSMWNGHTPNEIEFTAFSDACVCALIENPPDRFSRPLESASDLFMDFFGLADYEVWRCPQCGRLYVFDRQSGSDAAKFVYKLEEEP